MSIQPIQGMSFLSVPSPKRAEAQRAPQKETVKPSPPARKPEFERLTQATTPAPIGLDCGPVCYPYTCGPDCGPSTACYPDCGPNCLPMNCQPSCYPR